MKTILPIVLSIILMTLLVFSASAQSYGSGLPFRPVLDYTFTADSYHSNAPVLVSGAQQFETTIHGPDDDIADVATVILNYSESTFENFNQAQCDIYYDFIDATVSGEEYRPSFFTFQYSPFSIRYGDVFRWNDFNLSSVSLLDNIGAVFEWYGGSANADVSLQFNLRVYSVEQRNVDLQHNIIEYSPRTHLYHVNYEGSVSGRVDSSQLDLDDLFITDVDTGDEVLFPDFYQRIITSTAVMRGVYNDTVDEMYVDIEGFECSIYATNAPFSGVIHKGAPYIDVDGYEYVNGLFWNVNEGLYPFRQQRRGDYVAVMASNNLNKRTINNIDFEGDYNNPIVRVPALFLNAVSAFFDIDFFGLGFTIGNIIGVLALALMVVVFLRLFAGG